MAILLDLLMSQTYNINYHVIYQIAVIILCSLLLIQLQFKYIFFKVFCHSFVIRYTDIDIIIYIQQLVPKCFI